VAGGAVIELLRNWGVIRARSRLAMETLSSV
jgi:hypothetical protein